MTATNRDPGAAAPPESATADRELVATRVFDAPRALVFKSWTDPEHVGKWWGPNGFTTTTYSMDVKPGGVWRYCMHGPDGVDYQNEIKYVEVVEPERLVYHHYGANDDDPVTFDVTVTFEEVGGKTKLTMRSVFPTAEALAFVVREFKADHGLRQTLDRLVAYATSLAAAPPSGLTVTLPSDLEIAMTRAFDAPRRLVFEAMTKPEHVSRWWGPHGTSIVSCEMDLRPGGSWRFVLRGPDGQDHPFKGVYREVVPPERVVSTFVYDVEGIRDHEAVETMTLDERDGKTLFQVTIRHKTKEARDGQLHSGMEGGAAQSYDRLAELLKTLV